MDERNGPTSLQFINANNIVAFFALNDQGTVLFWLCDLRDDCADFRIIIVGPPANGLSYLTIPCKEGHFGGRYFASKF